MSEVSPVLETVESHPSSDAMASDVPKAGLYVIREPSFFVPTLWPDRQTPPPSPYHPSLSRSLDKVVSTPCKYT